MAENVRKASGSESFEAVYLTNTKQVVFDASMFTGENAAKLAEIVVHEVAIHKGLRAALGEKLFTRTTIDIWGNLSGKERAKTRCPGQEIQPPILPQKNPPE